MVLHRPIETTALIRHWHSGSDAICRLLFASNVSPVLNLGFFAPAISHEKCLDVVGCFAAHWLSASGSA
jgi:hypothetical protein